MKSKILVWLDANLTQFGIIAKLEKILDSELYAIVDAGKQREFYEKQNFVNFKKIWFLQDYLEEKRTKVDLNNLKIFEEKYKVNLWDLAYSDPVLNEHNKFYNFSYEEILSIFESEIRLFESVLNEVNPEFIIIRISDVSQIELLYQMCISRKIKPLVLTNTRLGYRSMISDNPETMYRFKEKLSQQEISNQIDLENDKKKYLKKYTEQMIKFRRNYQTSKLKKIQAILKFIKIFNDKKYKKHYSHFGMSVWSVFCKELEISLKRPFRKKFLLDHSILKINNEKPFIYFPLHFQPERSTLILSPYYTNQLELVENIAKSLPIDYTLLVKEHPKQGVMGWREIGFYKKIIKIPNVKLVHISTENEELINNSSIVITVTGTSGLEAAMAKKPSIILADLIYSDIPSVHRLKKIEELPKLIQDILETNQDYEFKKIIKTIEENSFEFDFSAMRTQINERFYFNGFFRNVEISEKMMGEFLEENKDVFDKLAIEHKNTIEEHIETR